MPSVASRRCLLLLLLSLPLLPLIAADNITNTTLNNTLNITLNNSNSTNVSSELPADWPYDFSLQPLLPDTVYDGIEYDGLFRVRNLRYETGRSFPADVTVAYELTENGSIVADGGFSVSVKSWKTAGTGTLTLPRPGSYQLCGRITAVNVSDANESNDAICQELQVEDPFARGCNVSLGIELAEPKLWYEEGETIRYYNRVERHDDGETPPYIIRYWIGDLDGNTVRVTTTENGNQKRYTPKADGAISAYVIRNSFDMLACDNVRNATGGAALVLVKGEAEMPETASTLEVEPPEGARFGERAIVKVSIYRGNTSKYAVRLWIEDSGGRKVSDVTTVHAKEKYRSYDLALPLSLEPAGASGMHRIVLEGLGEERARQVWIAPGERAAATAPPVSISSFFTRSKKATDSITLYATVKGNGTATLTLIGLEDHHEEEVALDGSRQYGRTVSMRPGPNLFVLEARLGTQAVRKVLLLEMDEEIRRVDRFTMTAPEPEMPECPGPEPCPACPERASERTAATVTAPPMAVKREAPPVTAMTVYEEESPARLLPLLGGLLGILLLAIALQRR